MRTVTEHVYPCGVQGHLACFFEAQTYCKHVKRVHTVLGACVASPGWECPTPRAFKNCHSDEWPMVLHHDETILDDKRIASKQECECFGAVLRTVLSNVARGQMCTQCVSIFTLNEERNQEIERSNASSADLHGWRRAAVCNRNDAEGFMELSSQDRTSLVPPSP